MRRIDLGSGQFIGIEKPRFMFEIDGISLVSIKQMTNVDFLARICISKV